MKVMMLGVETKQTETGQPPTEEAMLAMHKFNEELRRPACCSNSAASRRAAAACASGTAGTSAR